MFKLIIGFVAFASLALFVLAKSGGDIDMSGEKHGVEAGNHAPAPTAAAASAPAAPKP